MLIYISLLIASVLKSAISVGQCGPDYYIPETPTDCIPFGNSTHACCLLDLERSPVDYQFCFSMELTDVTPIISIGKVVYRIRCQGIPNFAELFPLEGEYKACGVSNPVILSDCWSYNTKTERCCMVGKTEKLLLGENPMCYYFPPNEFTLENFTITTQHNKQMYVGCGSSNIKINIISIISIISIICLFVLI